MSSQPNTILDAYEIEDLLSSNLDEKHKCFYDSQTLLISDSSSNPNQTGTVLFDLSQYSQSPISLKKAIVEIDYLVWNSNFATTPYTATGTVLNQNIAFKIGSYGIVNGIEVRSGSNEPIVVEQDIFSRNHFEKLFTLSYDGLNQNGPLEQIAPDTNNIAVAIGSNTGFAQRVVYFQQNTICGPFTWSGTLHAGTIQGTARFYLSSLTDYFMKQDIVVNNPLKIALTLSGLFNPNGSSFYPLNFDATALGLGSPLGQINWSSPGSCRLYVRKLTLDGPDTTALASRLNSGAVKRIPYLHTQQFKLSNTNSVSLNVQLFQGLVNCKKIFVYAVPTGLPASQTLPFCQTENITNAQLLCNGDPLNDRIVTNQFESWYKQSEFYPLGAISTQDACLLSWSTYNLGLNRILCFDTSRMGKRNSILAPCTYQLTCNTVNLNCDLIAIAYCERIITEHPSSSITTMTVSNS